MFKSARIKLTAWYLLIIMAVTVSFSGVVYAGVSNISSRALEMHERKIENRLQQMPRFQPPTPRFQEPINEETVKEIKFQTLMILGLINLVVLFTAGILGYWLAGRTLDPIEKMTEKQKHFIADAAHELKTPLTAMKTQIEVTLRNKKLNLEQAKEVLNDTNTEIDSLAYLTNALLKQSKYQNYDNGNEFKNFNIKIVAEKIVKKLEPKAKDKKIGLNLVSEDIDIKGIKSEIAELMTLLVDNAIKFNKENGKVDLEIKRSGTKSVITVTDTGVGIDKKDLPYIFDRFYKSNSSRSKKENGGFGLGLSIAKEIVKKHRGTINSSSEIDKGTTFTVKIPIK